ADSDWDLLPRPPLEFRVRTVGPEDRRVFDAFREHARVTDTARVHRFDLPADRKDGNRVLEDAQTLARRFDGGEAENRTSVRQALHERGVDLRLQSGRRARRRGCFEIPGCSSYLFEPAIVFHD